MNNGITDSDLKHTVLWKCSFWCGSSWWSGPRQIKVMDVTKSISYSLMPCYVPSHGDIYLAPGGGCDVLFWPCLSVCLSGKYFGISFLGYIDLKCIQDTHRVVLNSLKKLHSYGNGQGHRDGTLLFKGTVISQKLSHRKFSFYRHLLGYSIRWNNKNLSEQRNDVTKIRQYMTLTCKTPIPKLLFLIKSSTNSQKNMAFIQPRPTHIPYECAKFGDDRALVFNVICDVSYVLHVKGL